MISLGPWLLFDFPPSTPSRAENQQQPRSQGNHLSAPCGIIYSSLRPDSFLKSLVILKMFALAALVQKFVRMTSDFKKLFTGPGKNYILPNFVYIFHLKAAVHWVRVSALSTESSPNLTWDAMGLRAHSARRLSVRAEPLTRRGRAESARNPIAANVKFCD